MVSANTGLGRRSPDEGGRISTLLPSNLIPSHQSVWVPLYDSCIIEGTVIDVRINKGNAVQSFMFKTQGWRSMGGIMENTSFWILVAIMQPLLYFISLEYFGQIVAIAIPWSILILFLIWMWASGKNPFASDEEE